MEISGVTLSLYVVFIFTLIVFAYLKGTRNLSVWKKQGIPGPRPIPFFGNFLEYMKEAIVYVDVKMVKRYGKIIGVFNGNTPGLLVADPEFLRQAMIKEFSKMPNRQRQRVPGYFGLALTLLTNDHWRHVRHSITPTFTTGKLKQMMPLIEECGDTLVKTLKQLDGKPFKIKNVAGNYTMDVIGRTAFGVHVDSQNNPNSPLIKYGKKIMGNIDEELTFWGKLRLVKIFFFFLFVPNWLVPYLYKIGITSLDMESTNYFSNITNKILDDRSVEQSNRRDFVQLSMDQLVEIKDDDKETKVDEDGNKWSEKGLTRDEIVANAVVFMLAGFETTATSTQFFFYEMAHYPGIQQELFKEMIRICSSSTPSYEEIAKLGLLDRCIEETLRLYPAGFRFDRVVSEDVTVNGVSLRAGYSVSAAVYAIHHDPELWPEPEEFKPERFTAENKEGRHPCSWIPFGIGNRNCIGMRLALLEMKVACVKVLWNFKIERCDGTPARPLKFAAKLGFVPEKPIMLTAIPRIMD